MTCQPSWIRGGGVVAHLHPEKLDWELPAEAALLEEFHITLIRRRAFVGLEDVMATFWPDIAGALPPPPNAELGSRVFRQVAGDCVTWFLHVVNQKDFTDYVQRLNGVLDTAFDKSTGAGFENPEADRYFHMTIANNQGGDPMKSIGSIRDPSDA